MYTDIRYYIVPLHAICRADELCDAAQTKQHHTNRMTIIITLMIAIYFKYIKKKETHNLYRVVLHTGAVNPLYSKTARRTYGKRKIYGKLHVEKHFALIKQP